MPRLLIRRLLWLTGLLALATVLLTIATAAVFAQASTLSASDTTATRADPLQEAMQEYTAFAPYDAGIILPEQISQDIFDEVFFIDTRTAEEFAVGTIPGASHIEWREVIGQMHDIPATGMVILFCNTGALSAQAVFGLRVLGRENVLILQTGYHGWLENAAYMPKG